MILWHNVFGKSNNQNQDILTSLTNAEDIDMNFFNLNILCKIFPNLDQIEYFNKTLNKKQILNLTDSIMKNSQSMNEQGTKVKYIIIHHEYSSMNNTSNKSLLPSFSTSISQQPLLINAGSNINQNLNNHWIINHRNNKIMICKSNDLCNIDSLKYLINLKTCSG